MNFMGDPIQKGDVMYDIIDGPITVVSVHHNHIRAQKGANPNSARTYGYDGILTGRRPRRTLFWHDPIALEPRKSEKAWQAQLAAVRKMSDLLAQVAMAYEDDAELRLAQEEPTEQEKLATFLKNEVC